MRIQSGRTLFEGLEARRLLATFLVDQASDESDGDYGAGDLSLREAVELANANSDADEIGFSSSVSALALTLGEIAVAEDLHIAGTTGGGVAGVTISGDGSTRLFSVGAATVTLEGLLLTGGDAGAGMGGAVYAASAAVLTVDSCVLTGNTANRGGAIANDGGTLSVSGSSISGNTALDSGGGIYTSAGSSTTISSSTVSGNDANTGGGIRNRGSSLTITSCTISGNSSAGYGGGLYNQGVATVKNSTIALNIADDTDQGLGTGGGIYASSAKVTLQSTIVARNLLGDGASASDIKTGVGHIDSASSNNLVGDAASAGGLSDGVNGNIVGEDPLLGALADNGGPTATHALLPESPALQAGAATGITTDQRGYERTGGAAPDIGAFEAHAPAIGGLDASASAIYRGDPLSLLASDVTDGDENIAQVAFFADADGDGIADAGELLGTDSDGSDGYGIDLSEGQTALFDVGDLTFLAVGADSLGYGSEAASVAVTVQHRPPSIGAVSADAGTIFRGDGLGLTATGVSEGDSPVASVAFYADSDGDGIADAGEILGLDSDGADGFGLTLVGGQTESFDLGELSLLAVATDSLGYESDTASTSVMVEYRAPTIGGVIADKDTLRRGEPLGLSATGVGDGDGAVASVSFFIDRDGDGVADSSELLGTDSDGSGGFTLQLTGPQTESFDIGEATILAVAMDELGYESQTVSTVVTVEHRPPTLDGLAVDVSSLFRGEQITLSAEGAGAGDAPLSRVRFYLDADGDGIADAGELLGADSDGADGFGLVVAGSITAGFDLGEIRLLAIALDEAGYESPAASASVTVEYRPPTLGGLEASRTALRRGSALTLTASDVGAGDSSIEQVRFYLDADGDGIADPAELLGADSLGSDGFSLGLTGAETELFNLGEVRLLALAVDALGHESQTASVTVTVTSTPPTIGGLSPSAGSISEGEPLTLTAEGVSDLGGAPAGVAFYLDADGDGVGDPGELLAIDTDGSDGYTCVLTSAETLALGRGEHAFLAVASDELGDASATASGAVTVSYAQTGLPDAPAPLASTEDGDLVSVTRNAAGELVVFIQSGDGWASVHLRDATGAPPATGDAVIWTGEDGVTRVAGPSVEGFILYTRGADGTWSFRNLTLELGIGSEGPVGALTRFVSRPAQGRGAVVIAGINASGAIVAFQQAGAETDGSPAWRFVNISDDLAAQGMPTPRLTELISYVTPWNSWTLAGIDPSGDIQGVWLAPAFERWRVDNLSAITGAPPLVGQLTVTQTAWSAINLGGVDAEGHLVITWWIPRFAGRWVTSDLTGASGGAFLETGRAAGFVTPWGAINYVGFNAEGEVTAYWWTPQSGSWVVTPLTVGLPEGLPRPAGTLTSHVSEAGAVSIVGAGEEGEIVRLWWTPEDDGGWRLTDLSDEAVRGG